MRTDYKDYIPSTAQKKYKMTNNEDGTVSFADVTDYTQEGDKLSAGVLNELSQNAVWPLAYSKDGTTHNLSGLSGTSGMVSCVFTATADFTAGDTVTIDGESYTVQLSNGKEPDDNLFVSGASVSVIVDTGSKKVNFKSAGGANPPAMDWAIVKIYITNDTFVVPKTATYRITAIARGGNGANAAQAYPNYYSGGGGGSGGGCELIATLQKGESYVITSGGGNASFGNLASATVGGNASKTTGGIAGTSSGGTALTASAGGSGSESEDIRSSSGGLGGWINSRFVPSRLYNQGGSSESNTDAVNTKGLPVQNIFYPFGTGGGGGGRYNGIGSNNGTSAGSGAAFCYGAVIIELMIEE